MLKNFSTLSKNSDQQGAAIIMALFFFTLASFVVFQLSQETLTESTLAGQELKKIQSFYSAQAGLEMALLRIKAFQEAKVSASKLGQGIAGQIEGKLDIIWQFPLPWPLPLTDDSLSTIARQEGEEVTNESLISKLNFIHTIKDSGTQLDLNSLGSPIETISEASMESLMRSFSSFIRNDEEFRDLHSEQSVKEVLNNIADWVDPDEESRNGGSESQFYTDEDQVNYPRNQSFMSFSELLLVAEMDDAIYDKLRSLGTVFGTFGVNVNTAGKDTLMSIDEQFTDYTTDEFIKRRTENKAQTGQDLDRGQFDDILYQLGFRNIEDIHSSGLPILFSPLTAFYIESSGVHGEIETIINAHVIDALSLKDIFVTQLDKSASKGVGEEEQDQDSDQEPQQQKDKADEGPTPQAPQGKPFIIHMEIQS